MGTFGWVVYNFLFTICSVVIVHQGSGRMSAIFASQLVICASRSKENNGGNLGLMNVVAMLRWDMSSLLFGVGPMIVCYGRREDTRT